MKVGRRVGALLAATLLAAACSGGKKAGTPSSRSTPTTGVVHILSACAVWPASEAAMLFGKTAKVTTVSRPSGAVSVCGWTADTQADPNDPRDISYKIEVDAYQGGQYYTERSFQKPTRLAGIGDHAFIIVTPDILQGQVEKNGNVISVSYSVTAPFVRPAPTATAHMKEFLAALRAAAARM